MKENIAVTIANSPLQKLPTHPTAGCGLLFGAMGSWGGSASGWVGY